MNTPIILFIGAGNMGGSLIRGLIENGHPPSELIVNDTNTEKAIMLQQEFGIVHEEAITTAIQQADVVILAVKPQVLKSVLSPLATAMQTRGPLLISVAAGITVASMQTWLNGYKSIVRAMPNTPALIGVGATGLFAHVSLSDEKKIIAESILKTVGMTVWLKEESQLDTVTALSGSGPAYFFLIMEAFAKAAESFGLPADIAKQLIMQTALGAAKMAQQSPDSLSQLRKNVTSPGGTTEKGLQILEEHHLHSILQKTIEAAKKRSEELAQQLGETKV